MSQPASHDATAPRTAITAPDGASARVYHDGAHVASWMPAGGTEQLFVSANARYGAGQAMRGGVPICWPQFGPFGALPQHGFARVSRWTLRDTAVGDAHADATFVLEDSAATRAVWPHRFHVAYTVRVGGAMLTMALAVHNTGEAPFTFTGALHPYFRVPDALRMQVVGLAGTRRRDALADGREDDETAASVEIHGPIDRIYYGAAQPLLVEPCPDAHAAATTRLRIEMEGFHDAVVWNPGAAGTAARPDFVPGDEHHMLCVEAAVVRHPVTLAPGASWTGVQRVQAVG